MSVTDTNNKAAQTGACLIRCWELKEAADNTYAHVHELVNNTPTRIQGQHKRCSQELSSFLVDEVHVCARVVQLFRAELQDSVDGSSTN